MEAKFLIKSEVIKRCRTLLIDWNRMYSKQHRCVYLIGESTIHDGVEGEFPPFEVRYVVLPYKPAMSKDLDLTAITNQEDVYYGEVTSDRPHLFDDIPPAVICWAFDLSYDFGITINNEEVVAESW